jgi:hypothetical protein
MIEVKLDDDTLTRVFTFLRPSELLKVEFCCKRWKECSNHDHLWTPHIKRLWKQFKFNVPSNFILIERVKELPISTLKSSLNQVNRLNCIEKVDYQKLLAARLFLRGRNCQINFPSKIVIPKCVLKLNEHKASYYFAKKEVIRNKILLSEITMIKWRFFFKHNEGEGGWEVKYFSDFTMESQLHGSSMQWQFIDYDIIEGGHRLQVEQ